MCKHGCGDIPVNSVHRQLAGQFHHAASHSWETRGRPPPQPTTPSYSLCHAVHPALCFQNLLDSALKQKLHNLLFQLPQSAAHCTLTDASRRAHSESLDFNLLESLSTPGFDGPWQFPRRWEIFLVVGLLSPKRENAAPRRDAGGLGVGEGGEGRVGSAVRRFMRGAGHGGGVSGGTAVWHPGSGACSATVSASGPLSIKWGETDGLWGSLEPE